MGNLSLLLILILLLLHLPLFDNYDPDGYGDHAD